MFKKLAAAATALVLALLPVGAVSAAALNGNPIANPSVETAITDDWMQSGWSTDQKQTPAYEVVTGDAHQGNKSLKVTMSNYSVDGDAKWYFKPLTNLTVGGQYRFTNWYKTNVQPQAVAMYIDAAGNETFYGMPTPTAQVGENAATTWQPYSSTFSVPQGAVAVSVFMYINQNGWLQTDDYNIQDYTPTGFSSPMITLTFDDGHEDNKTNALPLMNSLGFKSTQCYATSFLEGFPQEVIDGALAFYNSGHEICSHTVTHPDLTTQTAEQLSYELGHSKQYLEGMIGGNTVPNFASPFGAYNATVNNAIKAAGYQSHRTVNEGYNTMDNFNAYELKVQNMLDTTTLAQYQSWVEQAIADKTWLILVYHRVADNPGQYDTKIADFNAQMNYLKTKESQIAVKTFQDAFVSAKAQADGTTNPGGDTHAPVISNVGVTNDSLTTRVDWKADEFAAHTFQYGKVNTYGSQATPQIAGEGDLTNSRYVTLSLERNTKYYYKIVATDNAGNIGSIAGEFTTPAATGDTTPPVISNVNTVAGGIEAGGGYQVNWSTNETATGQLEYGTTAAYGKTVNVAVSPFGPTFVHNIYDLASNTKYFFRITATDTAGNSSTHTGEFTTPIVLIPAKLGDLDKDGDVDGRDLSTLLANWRVAKPSATPLLGDVDGNGLVNGRDLSTLLANWSIK